MVTRSAQAAPQLAALLREVGARALEVPTIALAPPSDGGQALATSVARLHAGAYAWAVFTSPNAVERVFELVPDTRCSARTKVAAVGPATADALTAYRVVADLVPSRYRAEGLLESFPPPPPTASNPGGFPPQAAGARDELRRRARRGGVGGRRRRGLPHRPPSHRTGGVGGRGPGRCHLFRLFFGGRQLPRPGRRGGQHGAGRGRLHRAGHGRRRHGRRGLQVSAEASEHTLDGLVAALLGALGGPGSPDG